MVYAYDKINDTLHVSLGEEEVASANIRDTTVFLGFDECGDICGLRIEGARGLTEKSWNDMGVSNNLPYELNELVLGWLSGFCGW